MEKQKPNKPLLRQLRVISLTDFVEFIHSTGETRLQHVKRIKKRGEYDPKTDFWLKMRKAIVKHASSRNLDFDIIEQLMRDLTDPKKRSNYSSVVEGYRKFVKRHKGKWLPPPVGFMDFGMLRLNVNPELGFKMGNKHVVVKLYFKSEPITPSEARVALMAMDHVLSSKAKNGLEFEFRLLDVRRNKMYALPKDKSNLFILFLMEQDNFLKIYKAV